jgi:Tol biopolymer transport system component
VALYALVATVSRDKNDEPANRAPDRLTYDDGLQTQPVFSPDGQWVAYAANVAGQFDIWTARVSGGNPVRVTTHTADDWQPDWSPDGNSIVFRSERGHGGIYSAPVNGGPEQQLTDFGFRPVWSPDGGTIVFARSIIGSANTGLHSVRSTGGPVRPLSQTQPGAFGWLATNEIFVLTCLAGPFIPSATSIDVEGREIAKWHVDEGVGRRFLQTKLSVAGGEPTRWVARQNAIFFVGDVQGFRSVWRVDVDRKNRRILAGPYPVTTSIEATTFSITGDGRRLTFGASRRAARLWSYPIDAAGNLQEAARTPLTAEAVHAEAPSLSSDGERLLYRLGRPASRQQRELITRNLSTGHEQTQRVLDEDRGVLLFPRWSTDGKQLSYTRVTRTSSTTAEQQVIVFDPATNLESPLTSPVTLAGGERVDLLEHATGWSPDDRFVISSSPRYKPGFTAIVMLRVADAPSADKSAQIITATPTGTLSQSSMSPDGQWVIFRVNGIPGARTARVAIVSVRGGEPADWTVLTGDDFSADKPRWSADGGTIFFTSDNGGVINLWSIPFDRIRGRPSGAPRRQTAFTGPALQLLPDIRALEIGLARNRIVLPLVEQSGGIWISEHPR